MPRGQDRDGLDGELNNRTCLGICVVEGRQKELKSERRGRCAGYACRGIRAKVEIARATEFRGSVCR